jgi:ATP-binding cassette subfamily F protein 3
MTLSGGQKSRLAFALLGMMRYVLPLAAIRLLLCAGFSPNYLIMDEPTNHLDVETVEALGRALNNYKVGYSGPT